MAGLAARGARGGLITLVSQGLSLITRLAGIVVLARLLVPSDFGLVAIASAITLFVTAISFLGLPMAVVQVATLGQRAKSSLFVVNVVLGLVLGAAMYFSADALSGIYAEPGLAGIIRWLAIYPVLSGLQQQSRAHLIRELRFTSLAWSEVSGQVAGVLIAIGLAAVGAGVAAIVAQVLVQAFIRLVLVVTVAHWLPGRLGKWREEVLPILRTAIHISGANLVKNASQNAIVPIMGLFVAPHAIGNFDRAQQIAIAPVNIATNELQRVAIPVLSRLRSHPKRMLAYMQRAQMLGAYGTATAFLVGAALAQPLVVVLLGAGWYLAGSVLQVLALGAMFRTLGQTIQWLFIAADATKQGLTLSLWSQPAIAVITLAGIPWGVMGAAIGNTIAWALYWPVVAVWAAKAVGFPIRALLVHVLRAVGLFGLPVAIAAFAARLFGLSAVSTIVIGLGLALIVAASIGVLLPMVRQDLGLVLDALRLALTRDRKLGEVEPSGSTLSGPTGDSRS